MRLSRWLGLLGLLVVAGGLQVAQRTLIVLKGYGVGKRLEQVHDREVALALLDTRLTGLQSPSHLARIANERQLKLVAWSRIGHAGPAESAGRSTSPGASSLPRAAGSTAQSAAPAVAEAAQLAAWNHPDDTAD